MKTEDKHIWWQKGIVYQIYPRSFKDSNGDGIGDLNGIIEKLDYLEELAVSAIWISPIYPSPMADFGYDVADYTGIHPLFGEMEDFDRLLQETHKRGLKMILDFVPNHTSNEHPWFLESRSSKDNPKRDWYLWKDPAPDGGPPNNWLSEFGGRGWEFDETTGQYYYHAYLKEQPDLNWRNPEVQIAMLNNMKFWLDKGVDGFRVDVMWHMIKDDEFRDNPPNPDFTENLSPYKKLIPAFSTDQPEVHDVVMKMRDVIDRYEERLLIGEIYLPISKLVTYYGQDNQGAHLPFNFQLIVLPWDAKTIEAAISEYEGSLPPEGWPNWVLGNHDKSRIATRVGSKQARVAAMLLLTLKGTPTLYYGDEIGMQDVEIPADQVQDPHEKNVPGKGLGRDPERTPMQWDASEKAGFTTGEPWLPLAKDFKQVNVEGQRSDPDSMYHLYKRLIAFRNDHKVLQVGDYSPIFTEGNLLCYRRLFADQEFLVALNLSHQQEVFVPKEEEYQGVIRISTHREREGEKITGEIKLAPDQGVLIEVIPPNLPPEH